MRSAAPSLHEIDITEVNGRLESLLRAFSEHQERFLIGTSAGPVAALIPVTDLRRLIELDEQDRAARAVVADMRAAFRDVPDEEIERQTESIMAEIRKENRAARARAAKPA
jgi:hypothetical protein